MLWRRKNFLISMFKKENYSLVFFIIYLDIADISAFLNSRFMRRTNFTAGLCCVFSDDLLVELIIFMPPISLVSNIKIYIIIQS